MVSENVQVNDKIVPNPSAVDLRALQNIENNVLHTKLTYLHTCAFKNIHIYPKNHLLVSKILHGKKNFHLFKNRPPVLFNILSYSDGNQPNGFEGRRSFFFLKMALTFCFNALSNYHQMCCTCKARYILHKHVH